jgi:hypothetical protein
MLMSSSCPLQPAPHCSDDEDEDEDDEDEEDEDEEEGKSWEELEEEAKR